VADGLIWTRQRSTTTKSLFFQNLPNPCLLITNRNLWFFIQLYFCTKHYCWCTGNNLVVTFSGMYKCHSPFKGLSHSIHHTKLSTDIINVFSLTFPSKYKDQWAFPLSSLATCQHMAFNIVTDKYIY